MDWLTALLLALIIVLAHLLLDQDGGAGGNSPVRPFFGIASIRVL